LARSYIYPDQKYAGNAPNRDSNYYYSQNMPPNYNMYQPNYPMMNPNPYYCPYYPPYNSKFLKK